MAYAKRETWKPAEVGSIWVPGLVSYPQWVASLTGGVRRVLDGAKTNQAVQASILHGTDSDGKVNFWFSPRCWWRRRLGSGWDPWAVD